MNIQAGSKIHRLTVIEFPLRKGKSLVAKCVCECGRECFPEKTRLQSDRVKSCGCYRLENLKTVNVTHGARFRPVYKSWAAMRQRTTNPNNPDWKYYGGRGISCCERWQLFENFLSDMGHPAPGQTIDRIDVDGNYDPSNCRWADRALQSSNRRKGRVY